MIVVDASVAVKWYAPETGHLSALDLIDGGEVLVAPDLVILEVLNTLRQKMKRREITAEQFQTAPDLLDRAFAEYAPAKTLAPLAASLSLSIDPPIYDCAYLACAMLKSAVLVTADRKLLRKVVEHRMGHLVRPLVDRIDGSS